MWNDGRFHDWFLEDIFGGSKERGSEAVEKLL